MSVIKNTTFNEELGKICLQLIVVMLCVPLDENFQNPQSFVICNFRETWKTYLVIF